MRMKKKKYQEIEKDKIPTSVDDTIPIERIFEDGVFLVGKNLWAKTYRFTDINYEVASKADKEKMFLAYCEILNMFEPTTLPRAMPLSPLLAATIDVTSSGNDVPTATIVSDITASLIPQDLANTTADSRNKSPPTRRTPSDTAAIEIVNHNGFPERALLADSSYSSCALLALTV